MFKRILFIKSFVLWEIVVNVLFFWIFDVWNVNRISVLFIVRINSNRMKMFCLGLLVKVWIDDRIFE